MCRNGEYISGEGFHYTCPVLEFRPCFTGHSCTQGAGLQRSLTQPDTTLLHCCNKVDQVFCPFLVCYSYQWSLNSWIVAAKHIDGDPPSRNGGGGICPFMTYLETTSLQARPPQRGYLRYPIGGLCTSGQPCVALHTRTQRQTAFGELPFLCGGTGRERPVCLVAWILLAVSPVWLLSVSVASNAINQGPEG